MSVKEVLQSLVDDNLVDTDKIGTSIYFWAYPSKAMHTVSLDHHLYQSFKHQQLWATNVNFIVLTPFSDSKSFNSSQIKSVNVKRKLPLQQSYWSKLTVAESSQ